MHVHTHTRVCVGVREANFDKGERRGQQQRETSSIREKFLARCRFVTLLRGKARALLPGFAGNVCVCVCNFCGARGDNNITFRSLAVFSAGESRLVQ